MAPTNGHTNGINGHGHDALCSIDEFTSQKFDFLVVGGGTAGCCIAARLTEDPNITVGVIEAGKSFLNDKNVSTPSLYPTLIGRKEYDWCMTSIPQPDAGGKIYSMPRGKGLGGSSAINYLMYVRGSRKDYDGWAEICGDKSWGWEGLAPYFKKHQTLDKTTLKSKDPQFHPHAGLEEWHGTDGPIHTSFNDWYMTLEEDFAEAAYAVTGTEKTIKDAWSGDHLGFYSSLGAVDRSNDRGRRSYAATGYIRPNLHRPNLKIITEAHATKVILEDTTAIGVEFLHDGQKYRVPVSREVILSAGVIQTPQLLELSGIGDPSVLEKVGIPCIVENKDVGANFQDHVLGGLLYDLKPGIESMDALHGTEFQKVQQEAYDKYSTGLYANPGMMMGFVSYASIVTPEELNSTISSIKTQSHTTTTTTNFSQAQEKIILDQLSDPSFANLQTFCIPCRLDVSKGSDQTEFFGAPPPGKQQVSLLICLEHPLSRGTVHITTSDPMTPPAIDPAYFRHPVDAEILAAGISWLDRVARHPLMAKSLGPRELPPQSSSSSSPSPSPSPSSDPLLSTPSQRKTYVKTHISTQYHLIGTAALGQVIDTKLRVKGVRGLRVCDASVFPGHVSGNIMASTYAVAEKGADLIREDIYM